jgi:formate-dependent nitrite reductase cytochrome c552 subunit
MNRTCAVALMLFCCLPFAAAQITRPTTDVLGAHLNYGRGCAACHTPHSGSSGNGRPAAESNNNSLLWGQELSPLAGRTITTGGGKYVEVLPASMSADTPDVNGMLTCLSCHDGNFASAAMMKNRVYESLPATYGNRNSIPTLIGSSGAGNYMSEHPMGLNATIGCGGTQGWDCSQVNGVIKMHGANASRFVSNYGFFVQPGIYNNTSVIVCTTCHDPHAMSVVTVNQNSTSGLPAGTYATMFFLRGPYNANDTNPMSNQTAQFCRQCHADKSNEMNGGSAGTVF